jgi:hypothetical protein
LTGDLLSSGRSSTDRGLSMLETETSTSTCEVQRLRRCIRDLVALSALPAVWIGHDPGRIAGDSKVPVSQISQR